MRRFPVSDSTPTGLALEALLMSRRPARGTHLAVFLAEPS